LVELFEDVFSFLFTGDVVVNTEKDLQCNQAVAACLMAGANALNTKLECQLVQSSTQVKL
jgi:hypothetical protein